MPRQNRFAVTALCVFVILSLSSAERWGSLPDDIDIDRSISLNTDPGLPFDKAYSPWVEQVGLHPKVFVFHNFLTPAERAHIVRVAAPLMRRSSVVGPKGDSVIDDIRTSYGVFIRRLADPIIERIERRISLFTHYPISHQEDIQVLRYTKGQKYGAHYDSAGFGTEPGPHYRQATFLMYLSDVASPDGPGEGGETAFPEGSQWYDPSIPRKLRDAGVKLSACAQGHVAAKPKAGDAVLFYSFHPNGTMDPASMHTGCPVISGIKWAAPVWIHVDEFQPQELASAEARRTGQLRVDYPREPGLCEDFHKQCRTWAAAGECTRNPTYMTGTSTNGDGGGMCMRACGMCTPCGEDDVACINNNRRRLGYLPLDRREMEWLGVPWWLGGAGSPEF